MKSDMDTEQESGLWGSCFRDQGMTVLPYHGDYVGTTLATSS